MIRKSELVVSNNTATSLYKCGWRNRTILYWAAMKGAINLELIEEKRLGDAITSLSAPTAEELLQRLPTKIDEFRLVILTEHNSWIVGYASAFQRWLKHHKSRYLAEAAARLWIDMMMNKTKYKRR